MGCASGKPAVKEPRGEARGPAVYVRRTPAQVDEVFRKQDPTGTGRLRNIKARGRRLRGKGAHGADGERAQAGTRLRAAGEEGLDAHPMRCPSSS